LSFNDDAGEGESWKLPAIRDCVGDRPFAYIDDAVGVDAVEWAATRPAPTLLLPISGDRGLLAADVGELERFAHEIVPAAVDQSAGPDLSGSPRRRPSHDDHHVTSLRNAISRG